MSDETESTTNSVQAENKVAATKTKTSRKGSWLNGFLFVVVFAVLAASAYAHWWQYQRAQQFQQSNAVAEADFQQKLAQQNQQLQMLRDQELESQRSLSQQLQTADQALQEQQSAQTILAQQLEAQNQRLLQLSSTNSENWELAEALYLTRLANQRLVMEQNREAALALLEGADDILAKQRNPELFKVREILSQDITALKVVEAVDREGLFLRLSALHEQLQQLPLTQSLNFNTRNDSEFPNPVPEEDQSFWEKIGGSFQHAFGRLDNYVRKIDLEGPVKPLLAPDEQESIRLAISLYLESAQIALLRSQPLVFKNALAQAQQQITQYYPDSNQRQELVLALQTLQQESVKPNLPDISHSYLRLNDFVQSHVNQATATTEPAQQTQGDTP